MAEYNHGIGLKALVDEYLPKSGSNRGYAPSVFVDSIVLMLQGGGRTLEDLRELARLSQLEGFAEAKCLKNKEVTHKGLHYRKT